MKDNKKDISERQKLGITLLEVYQYVYDKSQIFFERFDLTSQQFNVLSVLYNAGSPLSTSDILKSLVEKNAGVSRMVDRLVAKGLVEKGINSSDKRLIDVQLTSKGKSLHNKVLDQLSEIDKIYQALDDKEVMVLMELLGKLMK